MSKLKPCPFCGSEVFLLDVATRSDANAKWDVYCRTHECFLNSGTNNMFSNREDAMIAWNNRAESTELTALREQVKVLREALEAVLTGNDIAYNRSLPMNSWMGSYVRRQCYDALDQTKPKDEQEAKL